MALYTDERIRQLVESREFLGDCFYCQMVMSNPLSKDIPTDHYTTHFTEKYVMLSTIYAASNRRGNPEYVLRFAPDLARRDLAKMLRKALLEGVMVNR